MKLSRLVAALLALIMMICALPVYAEIEQQYDIMYVSKTTMPVYKTASTSSKKVGVFSYGDAILVVKHNSSWAQITNDEGDIGYCRMSYLMSTALPNTYSLYYANTNDVPIYEKATTESDVIGELNYDDTVYANAVTPDGEFLRIQLSSGSGFVEKEYFERTPSGVATPVYINKTSATLRRGASNSYAKTGTAYFGEEFTMSRTNGGWAYVTNGVVSGWCQTNQFSYSPVNNQQTVYTANKDGVSVLGRNGKMLAEIDKLSYGEEVLVLAFTPDSAYAMVEFGDMYGYIGSAYLKYQGEYVDDGNDDDDDDFNDDPIDPDVIRVYVTANNVTAYKAPSASANKAGTVSYGESLTCLQISGDWALVENSAGQGWVPKEALSTKDPCSGSMTVFVSASKATVYQRPITSSKVLGTVSLNREVVLVGMTADKEWCRVEYNGGYGFIKTTELSKTQTGSAKSITVYVTVNNATAYKEPAEIAAKAGTVSYGEVLTCTQVSGDWALVKNSAGQGWVRKSMLSTKNPCNSSLTGYVKVNSVTVYQRPGTSYKALGKLSLNDEVTVVGRTPDKSWYRIMYAGGYGFVKTSSLTGDKPTDSGVKVYVRYNSVSAYATSSSSSNVVAEVYYGQELSLLSTQNGWMLVTNGKTQAWIKADALTTTDPNTSSITLYVKNTGSAVRKKPDKTGSVLTTFGPGDLVIGVAKTPDGDWVRIKYNGGYAFMAVDDLTTESPFEYEDENVGASGNDSIERVIALAVAQYGKPYIYADEGPDSYDCSGLVQYCFLKITGIKLRRTGHDQGYDERWPRIERIEDLERGDVVVFNTIEDGDDYSDHTGIYMGDGLFIHASSGAGKVIVSDLSSGYYNRKFSWGLRIIQ